MNASLELISLLLNLIFDNVFVVVILFGIISFLMNKMKGTNPRDAAPRRNAMPPFGGGGPLEFPGQGGRTKSMDAMPPVQPAGPVVQEMEWEPEPESVPDMAKRTDTDRVPPVQPSAPTVAAGRRTQTNNTAPLIRTEAMHARHAAQGMIWAEVFGQPRAKRPHGTQRR